MYICCIYIPFLLGSQPNNKNIFWWPQPQGQPGGNTQAAPHQASQDCENLGKKSPTKNHWKRVIIIIKLIIIIYIYIYIVVIISIWIIMIYRLWYPKWIMISFWLIKWAVFRIPLSFHWILAGLSWFLVLGVLWLWSPILGCIITYNHQPTGVSINGGSQNGWFIMEILFKCMIRGSPHFRKAPHRNVGVHGTFCCSFILAKLTNMTWYLVN